LGAKRCATRLGVRAILARRGWAEAEQLADAPIAEPTKLLVRGGWTAIRRSALLPDSGRRRARQPAAADRELVQPRQGRSQLIPPFEHRQRQGGHQVADVPRPGSVLEPKASGRAESAEDQEPGLRVTVIVNCERTSWDAIWLRSS